MCVRWERSPSEVTCVLDLRCSAQASPWATSEATVYMEPCPSGKTFSESNWFFLGKDLKFREHFKPPRWDSVGEE